MILHLIPGWASTADCWSAVLEHLGEFPVAHHCWSNPVDIPDEDCVLVGWSLGAMHALAAAGQSQVKGLVLLAGTTRFTSDGDHPGTHPRILQRMQAKLADGRDKVMSDFAAGCFHPHGEGTRMEQWLAGTRNVTT
ncbi:MAG: alpha/beta fold hydrolase, partial [Candidatus Sumerlaeia bacterium]|nr:alpha/beta fold hydrolase [Candidatus Sumerlaeia bacterium]